MHADSVSVVITRRVRPGREAEFERIVREWIPVSVTFPGHLGAYTLRPPPGGTEYGAVIRFRSAADWEAYRAWPAYAAFTESLRPHLLADPEHETLNGMEAWFLPHRGGHAGPPRWKMAVLVWVGVTALTSLVTVTLGPHLAGWPVVPRQAAAGLVSVAALTWGVLPVLTRVFRRWLLPPRV
jgi:antibiotic biosynthesis monooxygenase (ABM) superfamily enzyme